MKRSFSSLIILMVVFLVSCSKIPENTDPVLGIWFKAGTTSAENQGPDTKEEWIFNDAYLGRYQVYENQSVTFYTDFQWEQKNGLYTISYPGTEKPDQDARMTMIDEQEVLQHENGDVLAIRQ